MKSGYMILSAAAIVPLLGSCASSQTAVNEAWSIKPAFNVKHSTETPESYYQLGRYYQGQNRLEQAMTAYRKALARDGGFAEARNGLAVIYSMQGRLAEAIEQFRLAAEQSPTAAHIHNNLGYALHQNGLYAEAAQVLEHAVALDPANQAARANLAQAKEKAGITAPILAQAPPAKLAEKSMPEVQEVPPVAELQAVASPDSSPSVDVAAVFLPAQTMPPSEKVVEQVVPLPAAAQLPAVEEIAAVPASVAAVVSQPEPPHLKEGNAADAVVERNEVPLVESHFRVVQVAPNVYELLERVETQRALEPVKQAKVQDRGMIMPVAQGQRKPVRVAESRVSVARAAQAAQQVRATMVKAGAARAFRIEVSNGNGLAGMAGMVATFLDDFGYAGSRLTNHKTFDVPSSEVQYRTGYREEARLLTAHLVGKPVLVEMDGLRQDISIRVVLGKDWLNEVAYFNRTSQGKIRFARSGADS